MTCLKLEQHRIDNEISIGIPPRVDHLDVVGRLTPSMKWKPRIHSAPLTREPGRAVALGRVLVLT
jgi:hypothetical protein